MRALRPCLAALLLVPSARADEGMWTFDDPPLRRMKEAYGFAPDAAWLDHLRLASLRFPGGSGAFVSPEGLVLTNHHVAHDWILKLSGPDRDLVRDGFTAPDRAGELRVPGLVLLTLEGTREVTAEVERAVKPGMDAVEAEEARDGALRALAAAEAARTGLQCEPVVLYRGGQRWVYRYRRHEDVRLVAAPEHQIAAFGRDWDNFTFPRHDLDFAFFRVYEDGRPYRPPHFLRGSHAGLRPGDLTLTAGSPGRTARLATTAQMAYDRDVDLPLRIRGLERARKAYLAYAARGPEEARQVTERLHYTGNFIKAFEGERQGLLDRAALARLEAAEKALRARVAGDPELRVRTGRSWDRIAQALARRARLARELAVMDGRRSRLLGDALLLVRLADATPAARAAARERLLAPYDRPAELEALLLAAGLEEAAEELGREHPYVRALLGGRSPAEAARALLSGSRLGDPEVRKALLEGGAPAVAGSPDPAVRLARRLEALARPVREARAEVDATVAEHGARIAQARLRLEGAAAGPDATFTLRLSYGVVAPYPAGGAPVQPFTTFADLYDRAQARGPVAEGGSWALPPRWVQRRSALDLATPLDFITTNDIVGGNSGSPVVDREGRLVGLAFDGNLESLAGAYYYDGRANRMIALDLRAIDEALRKVMDAGAVAGELAGAGAPTAGTSTAPSR